MLDLSMKNKSFSVLLSILLQFAYCKNLSPSENAKLQKTCGRFKDLARSALHQEKSHGGEPVPRFFLPWVAFVGPEVNGHYKTCSGTQISSRHILTAAHCVQSFLPIKSDCKSDTPVSKSFLLRVGSECILPAECKNTTSSYYKAVKVTYVGEFDISYHNYADLAVIEVDKDIPSSEGRPVCIPPVKKIKLNDRLYAAGYGFDNTKNGEASLQLYEMEPIFEAGSIYAKGVDSSRRAQGPEPGDSGSGAIQIEKDGQIIVVGVCSGADNSQVDEESIAQDNLVFFTDVRKYSSWICKYTGICPDELNKSDIPFLPRAVVVKIP